MRALERTRGTLAGAVAVLVAAGWTRERIIAEVEKALADAKQTRG